MSKRVKVKEHKLNFGGGVGDMNGMFEEMMGMRDADKEIILPKFVEVRNKVRKIYRVFSQLANFKAFHTDFPDTQPWLEEIKKFSEELKEGVYIDPAKEELEETYQGMKKEDLNNLYRKLKENKYIKQLIILCSKLKRYEQDIGDKENLRDRFIGQEPGLSFQVFEGISGFDLKYMWVHDSITKSVKNYILAVIHHIYVTSRDIYKIITSPDVDVEKFSEVLMMAIAKLKKQPGLDRCHNAFKRIEQSVDLLQGNFENYYRSSVASNNPNIILESFIVDVSNQGGATATLTREFRKIIQFMHKAHAQSKRKNDPNIQKLFGILQQNFSLMEEQTGIADTGSDEEEKPTTEVVVPEIEVYKPSKESKPVKRKKKTKKKGKKN